ncbi:MAG: hypothetical protein R3A48_11210 [Polyangiales bacterium]
MDENPMTPAGWATIQPFLPKNWSRWKNRVFMTFDLALHITPKRRPRPDPGVCDWRRHRRGIILCLTGPQALAKSAAVFRAPYSIEPRFRVHAPPHR